MKALWERKKGADGRALVVHYLSADRAERFHHWYGFGLCLMALPMLAFLIYAIVGVFDSPEEVSSWIFLLVVLAIEVAAVFLWTEFDSVSGHEPPRLGVRGLWTVAVILHAGGSMAWLSLWWSSGGLVGAVFGLLLILPLFLGAWPSLCALRDECTHDYRCEDFDGRSVWGPVIETRVATEIEIESEGEDDLDRETRKRSVPKPSAPSLPPGPPVPPANR